ncbi:GNAT family N-acetyltransferase [Falsibacillus albus]|uniref:GNAT family N-acetyltransferase n=1 Tax=Falsibacillus albus TaxID=2478915 RepID=A0A3L7JTZ6_9BACI|nr:GNAT family N-acetyltransferase [Falsibacillus albus]RLQ94196.1 GNAT family N-acetyltransferase [Falsibacillus albus]
MTGQIVKTDIITLEFYHPSFHELLKNYHLSNEQKNFTGMPFDAIAKCERDESRHPILILAGQVPVGFFVLHGWNGVKAYHENERAILLRAYSVEQSYQGRGIAKKSLMLLPDFVKKHFPDKNEIILAVNHGNKPAQNLYKKAGFTDTGKRVMGRKGEQWVLNFNLSS